MQSWGCSRLCLVVKAFCNLTTTTLVFTITSRYEPHVPVDNSAPVLSHTRHGLSFSLPFFMHMGSSFSFSEALSSTCGIYSYASISSGQTLWSHPRFSLFHPLYQVHQHICLALPVRIFLEINAFFLLLFFL